jgi:hypothetical protein
MEVCYYRGGKELKYTDYIIVNGKRYTSMGTLFSNKGEANRRAKVYRTQRMCAVVRPVEIHGVTKYSIFMKKK